MVITIAVALMVVGHGARAAIIVQGTNTYAGINSLNGLPNPAYQLTIAYEVTESPSDVYTYSYTLTTTPDEDLTSFTIGGNTEPINTQTIGDFAFNYGQALPAGSGFNNFSVGWDWGFNSGITSDTVGFSSDIAPGLGTFTVNDDDIVWNSPSLIPAPVPEPSAYALLAGAALMFGLLKYRRPAKLQLQKISRRR